MQQLSLPPNVATAVESLTDILSRQPLRPTGLVAIGSVTLPSLWHLETSDIDLCIFIDSSWEDAMVPGARLLQTSLASEEVSTTVPPHALIDLQNRRVEAVISHQGVSFDLTWLTGMGGYIGTSWYDVRRDYLELYIGNLYKHGIVLNGVRPPHPKFDAIYPYYSEDLRRKRLNVLLTGLRKTFANLREISPLAYYDRAIRFHSSLLTFLQALFISRRTYPISYYKHIEYQLAGMLASDVVGTAAIRLGTGLSNEEILSLEEEWMELLLV